MNKNMSAQIWGNEEGVEPEDSSSDQQSITHPFLPSEIELISPPMNVGDLMDKLLHNEINLDTDFQRDGNLWDLKKQSRLIESILLGLRLPAFYFEKVEKRKWDIIDGLQRCWAIKNFCVDKTLALTGMEFLIEFDGKTFDELDYDFQRDIKTSPITVNLLTLGLQERAKYILFQRLNTGGMELTFQEIRNAVYHGVAIDTVKEMARSEAFLTATLNKIPTKRKEREDFVSRFVAFYLTDFEKYNSDLETFVNESMEILSSKAAVIPQMIADFDKAMNLASVLFGDDAFRKRTEANAPRNPINKAYFEVIAVSFSKLSEAEKQKLLSNQILFKENLLVLMYDTRFMSSLTTGTGKKERVITRFSLFQKAINDSMNGVKYIK